MLNHRDVSKNSNSLETHVKLHEILVVSILINDSFFFTLIELTIRCSRACRIKWYVVAARKLSYFLSLIRKRQR